LFSGECPGIPVRTRDGRVPDDGKPQSNVHRRFICISCSRRKALSRDDVVREGYGKRS